MVTINLRFPVCLRREPLNQKKSQNKNLLCLRQWGDVGMWSTLFAFTFLIAVALSLAAIRLNL
jgi:hypothetical protein